MSVSNQDLIKSLKQLYNQLEKSNFIMAPDVIQKFLKFLTTNEATFFVYKHASQNFNFDEVFEEAISTGRLRLPQEDYKIIVLVTRILFDIDRGKIALFAFLSNMFPDDKIQDSYAAFCSNIIYPYVQAFERLLSQSDKVVLDVTKNIQNKKISRQLVDLLQNNIVSIYELFVNDKTLQDSKKQEIYAILEGLDYAVDSGNILLIKSLWFGLKYALQTNKVYSSQVKAMENELSNYGII